MNVLRPSVVILLIAVGGASASARPASKKKPKPAAPLKVPEAMPEPSTKGEPKSEAVPEARDSTSSAQKFAQAKKLYDDLEYDQVIVVARAILDRDDLPLNEKIETYRLYASSLVITQDPLEGARLFRLLLRARPDYELPAKTPIKIAQVFSQVKNEEKAIAAQAERFEREKTVQNLRLLGDPPVEAVGGKPLPFSFRLKDPTNAVEKIQVGYRRVGQNSFATLPLMREEDGRWHGQVPADFTSDKNGFQLEYYVQTSDVKGPLLNLGNEQTPLSANVLKGTIDSHRPPPVPRWIFTTGVVLTAFSGVSAGVLGGLFINEQNRFSSLKGEVQGADLVAQMNRGNNYANAVTASLIALGVSALTTGLLTPFVNWQAK